MTDPVAVGVDLGTSSLKILAVGRGGRVRAQVERDLPVASPGPGWSEADPRAWRAAVRAGVERVLAESGGTPVGFGLTGQMHGTVLLDDAGEPVRPAVLWPDTRALDQGVRWATLPGEVRARLGGPFSPGMTGPVLAWLSEHEPASVAAAAHAVLPKDAVRGWLLDSPGAAPVTDRSDASATLLWDVSRDEWSPEACSLLGVAPGFLPAAVASDTVVGTVRGAPVCAGGGDTPVSLAAIEASVGGWRPDDLVVNLGTGAQVIRPVADPPSGAVEPLWHVYADCGVGRYAMVAILNAGLALTWARERLGLSWSAFADLARSRPPGAAVFRPFVTEERGALLPPSGRGPGWLGPDDAAARAGAAAEAQAFLVRRARDLLGAGVGRVLLVGGGGRDAWVQQLLADTLACEVRRVEIRSAAALGAIALVAGPDWVGTLPPRVVTPSSAADALERAYTVWLGACYPD